MLEFITEEISGQLVAFSETTPFKSYWIDELSWVYLTVVAGVAHGPMIYSEKEFLTLEEAVKAANDMESSDA